MVLAAFGLLSCQNPFVRPAVSLKPLSQWLLWEPVMAGRPTFGVLDRLLAKEAVVSQPVLDAWPNISEEVSF